jgi:hypothetical protein
MFGEAGYEWKTMSTLNLQLAKDCYTDMESLPVLYVFYMTNINTKIYELHSVISQPLLWEPQIQQNGILITSDEPVRKS